MNTPYRPRALAALALLPAALLLGACSLIPGGGGLPGGGSPDLPGDQSVEELLEGSTGGDVDFEMDGLPEGFPVDAVPLVQGDIVVGFTIPGTGSDPKDAWQVTIAVPDEATAESARDLLQAAGYSNESSFAWENGEYLVVVTWSEADGGWQLSYIVTEA